MLEVLLSLHSMALPWPPWESPSHAEHWPTGTAIWLLFRLLLLESREFSAGGGPVGRLILHTGRGNVVWSGLGTGSTMPGGWVLMHAWLGLVGWSIVPGWWVIRTGTLNVTTGISTYLATAPVVVGACLTFMVLLSWLVTLSRLGLMGWSSALLVPGCIILLLSYHGGSSH
jgi:hypothetical protein